MGTGASTADEWIELYNPSATTSVNLSGWKLQTTESSTSKSLSFTFSNCAAPLNCIIPPQGYLLLERTDDMTVSDIAADQFFTGTLPNSGSYQGLRLYSSTGQVIDTANSNGGNWPAGNTSTICTMERRASVGVPVADSDTAWITNTGVLKNGHDANGFPICGTPKNINWAFYVTPTPSPIASRTPTRVPTRTRTPVPNHATPEPVVLNEFLPHPHSDWNGDGKIDTGDEFIEIVNLGGSAISLSGWRLDDQNGDSPSYSIPSSSIQPGGRMVFFTSQTGLLLGNGGDSVRLFKSNGQIADAYTYGVVKAPDQSYCRIPDGRGKWTFGCAPTVLLANTPVKTENVGGFEGPAMCLSASLPTGVYYAECDTVGLDAWSQLFWDGLSPGFPLYIEQGDRLYIIE